MNPFIWVQPPGEPSAQSAHVPEALPATSQTVWSPVPLLSAGQEGFGHIDVGVNRGDAMEIGRSALDAGDRSVIDRLVNPLPVEWVALKGVQLDRSDNLTWRPPHIDLESSDVRGATATQGHDFASVLPAGLGQGDASHQPRVDPMVMPRDRSGQLHGQRARLELMASTSGSTEGSPAYPLTRHAATVDGKESLNEQFTRYGRSAWQREQSQLVGSAQRIVRERAD
jgi:hypothetical protein